MSVDDRAAAPARAGADVVLTTSDCRALWLGLVEFDDVGWTRLHRRPALRWTPMGGGGGRCTSAGVGVEPTPSPRPTKRARRKRIYGLEPV